MTKISFDINFTLSKVIVIITICIIIFYILTSYLPYILIFGLTMGAYMYYKSKKIKSKQIIKFN